MLDEKIYRIISEKSEDIIEEFINSMSETDSTLKERLRPASQEQIDRLIEISRMEEKGYQLPEIYLKFLRRMGGNDGGLFIISEDYDGEEDYIEVVIKQFEKYNKAYKKGDKEEILKMEECKNGIPLLFNDDFAEELYSLEHMEFLSKNEYIIIDGIGEIDTDDLEKSFADSIFREYLYGYFDKNPDKKKYSEKVHEKDVIYTRDCKEITREFLVNNIKGKLEKYKKYLIDNEYVVAWFSSDYNIVAIKDDVVVIFNIFKGSIIGTIMGEDIEKIKIIQADMVEKLDVKIGNGIL